MSIPSRVFGGPDADVILRAPLQTGSDKFKDFHVHKLILSIASTFFQDTFSPSPLNDEFPADTKVFFLGKHAYGTAAQISGATDTELSAILAYFPRERDENEKFKELVRDQAGEKHYPTVEVANIVGLSSRTILKLTSKVKVVDGDRPGKINIGLSIKSEAKARKVIGYSRKTDRGWEFSRATVALIKEYQRQFPEVMKYLEEDQSGSLKLSEVFPGPTSDARVKELNAWLVTKGIRDFEAVPLICDMAGKETVKKIEKLLDELRERRGQMKPVLVNGIPRQAVLKPAHAVHRLQNQRFDVGDKIVAVGDSGPVPLSIEGVVIGINAKTLDIVWDSSFTGGSTLGNRCSRCRGATVELHSCLNLSNPQMVVSTDPQKRRKSHSSGGPRIGTGQQPPPYSARDPPVNQKSSVISGAPTSEGTTLDIVQVSESAGVLETFLQLVYPIDPPVIEDLRSMDDLLQLASKYAARGVTTKLKKLLVSPPFLKDDPIGVFAVACRNNLDKEAKLAVSHTFSVDVVSNISGDNLQLMTAKTLHRLLVDHAYRRERLIEVVGETQRLRERTSPCRCGGGFVKEIRLELSKRPFLDREILERCLSSVRKSGSTCKTSTPNCVLASGEGPGFLSDIVHRIQDI